VKTKKAPPVVENKVTAKRLTLSPAMVRTLHQFRSKENTRYAINGICVVDGCIYATDGRKAIEFKRVDGGSVPPLEGGIWVLVGNEMILPAECNGTFPRVRSVMPTQATEIKVADLKTYLIEAMITYQQRIDLFKFHGSLVALDGLHLENLRIGLQEAEELPIMIAGTYKQLSAKWEVRAVFMPFGKITL